MGGFVPALPSRDHALIVPTSSGSHATVPLLAIDRMDDPAAQVLATRCWTWLASMSTPVTLPFAMSAETMLLSTIAAEFTAFVSATVATCACCAPGTGTSDCRGSSSWNGFPLPLRRVAISRNAD